MITIVNTVILFITYNFYYIGTVYKNSQASIIYGIPGYFVLRNSIHILELTI